MYMLRQDFRCYGIKFYSSVTLSLLRLLRLDSHNNLVPIKVNFDTCQNLNWIVQNSNDFSLSLEESKVKHKRRWKIGAPHSDWVTVPARNKCSLKHPSECPLHKHTPYLIHQRPFWALLRYHSHCHKWHQWLYPLSGLHVSKPWCI